MRQYLRREEGAVELFVALALVAILGITALVVDIGNAKQTRRNFQTAADSGSLAGAQKLLNSAHGGDRRHVRGELRIRQHEPAARIVDRLSRRLHIRTPSSSTRDGTTSLLPVQRRALSSTSPRRTPAPPRRLSAGSGTCRHQPRPEQDGQRHGLPEAEYQLRSRPQDQHDDGLQLVDVATGAVHGELCPLRHEHGQPLHPRAQGRRRPRRDRYTAGADHREQSELGRRLRQRQHRRQLTWGLLLGRLRVLV